MKIAITAALVTLATAGTAHAQDMFGANKFDGVFIGGSFDAIYAGTQTGVGAGAWVGARLSVAESVLLGLELDGTFALPQTPLSNWSAFYARVEAGWTVTDSAYLFANAGVGRVSGGLTENQAVTGLGVEVAVSDFVHLRAQADYVWRDPALGGTNYLQTKAGVVVQLN